MRLIITGTSGVLGTAVYDAFTASSGWEVLGLAFTNAKAGLQKLDLQDESEVERVFTEFKPDWVIHCAAERRPDVAQKVGVPSDPGPVSSGLTCRFSRIPKAHAMCVVIA
jgi:S-adenosylmethionine synthetase